MKERGYSQKIEKIVTIMSKDTKKVNEDQTALDGGTVLVAGPELPEVGAEVYLSVDADCPGCGYEVNLIHQIKASGVWDGRRELGVPECEVEAKCNRCNCKFLVTSIDY